MNNTGISPSRLAWNRFKKNPVSVAGLLFILLAVIISVAGYLISPDKVQHANSQVLEIALEKPGFSCDFLQVTINRSIRQESFLERILTGEKPEYTLVPIHSYRFVDDRIVVMEYSKYADDRFYSEYFLADVCFPIDIKSYVYDNGKFHVNSADSKQQYAGRIEDLRERVVENHW